MQAFRILLSKLWWCPCCGVLRLYDVVDHVYPPQSTTITKPYYQEIFHRLRDSILRKWPDWKLHDDNGLILQLLQTYLNKHSAPTLRQLPYSFDKESKEIVISQIPRDLIWIQIIIRIATDQRSWEKTSVNFFYFVILLCLTIGVLHVHDMIKSIESTYIWFLIRTVFIVNILIISFLLQILL